MLPGGPRRTLLVRMLLSGPSLRGVELSHTKTVGATFGGPAGRHQRATMVNRWRGQSADREEH